MGFWKWLLVPDLPLVVAKPAKVLDISEPVIKLLEMLKEDCWKPDTSSTVQKSKDVLSFKLDHITKKSLSVTADGSFHIDLQYNMKYTYTISDCHWMTIDERQAVGKAVEDKWTNLVRQHELEEKKKQRELYKQYLEEA